jgi:hypothetical protein
VSEKKKTTTIAVSKETVDMLFDIKLSLAKKLKRNVSYSEVIDYLIEDRGMP